MLTILDRPAKLCDGFSRREVLTAGGLSILGLSLPNLLRASEDAPVDESSAVTLGRAKNVIFLYLTGGPPQHETFDPKPNAPAEIRGVFKPISTNVPGIHFCELLPRTARIADKLAVVRSMATNDHIHSSSGAWVLTGYKYKGQNARTIQPTDWPWFGSLIKRYKPSDTLPALSSVWIPTINRLNENVTPAGQTGGFMGSQWDPERFLGDPADPAYKIDGFEPRIPTLRLQQRKRLLDQVRRQFGTAQSVASVQRFNAYQQQALDLMTSGKAQQAFAISEEPDRVRERYGRNRWGQTVLLARRLIEAGVRLVHVQWPREPGDNAVDNPMWDTHAQNHDRLEDVLCPMFDVGFTALIEDLDQRGLLAETLVVAIGEFGRTPKINSKAGRDHWGSVFSFVMAGAGISGGQVYGSSDNHGAFPLSDRVEPGDLTATMFHLLGLDHRGTFTDPLGREHALTRGEPIWKLLGTGPATGERVEPGGNVERVPPFDPERLLVNSDFQGMERLMHVSSPSRPKGWRVAPNAPEKLDDRLGVWLRQEEDHDQSYVAIGFNLDTGVSPLSFSRGALAYLAQEVRSPFAGTFRFSVRACGNGSSATFFEDVFQKHFTCRLVFFQYLEAAKRATERKELASVEFAPSFQVAQTTTLDEFELVKRFENSNPGGNFSFGARIGCSDHG